MRFLQYRGFNYDQIKYALAGGSDDQVDEQLDEQDFMD